MRTHFLVPLFFIVCLSCAIQVIQKVPIAEQEHKQAQHHYVSTWVLSDKTTIAIKLSFTPGWAVSPEKKPEDKPRMATFYCPQEEAPTFLFVTYGALYIPFDALCDKDLARLTKDETGEIASMSKLPGLMDDKFTLYQLASTREREQCVIAYYNFEGRYMVKFMLCNKSVALSKQLKDTFEKIIINTEISSIHATNSDQEAFSEAAKRVQKVGKEGMKEVEYAGGDGSTYEKAIRILEASNIFGCVMAQYAWLDEHYPGYEFIMHSGSQIDGREYSTIRFTHKGEAQQIVFDITACPQK